MDNNSLDPNDYGSIDIILSGVEKVTGVSPESIKSKSKARELAVPRQIVMWLASRKDEVYNLNKRFGGPEERKVVRRHTKMSLKEVGKALGGRHYSTVIHGRDFIEGIVETREKLGHLTEQEREILRVAYSVDHKLHIAKNQYEKIKSRRADDANLSTERENGEPETASSGTRCQPIKWEGIPFRKTSDSERRVSNILDYGKSCSGESRIVETHY